MKKILSCRRSLVAVFAISCLTWLGLAKGIDISGIAIAISGVAASVCAANAYQGKGSKTEEKD